MDASRDARAISGPSRIIAMLNQKGGVGKTTSAVNLGAMLADQGLRVCLLDLDPQGHLTLHLGVEPEDIEHTVYDVMLDAELPVEDALLRHVRPGLDALLSDVDLAGAETELNNEPDRQARLLHQFEPVREGYDVTIIDCPPSLGLLTLNALTLATEIYVPMQAHFLALQGVSRLLETVGLVCRSVNPELRVTGIVLCMHEAQTTLAKEIVADLDAFFDHAREQDVPWRDCAVLRPPIRRNIKLAEAPSFGQTILDYEPWCAGAIDYRKLAENLINRWKADAGMITSPVHHDEGEADEEAHESHAAAAEIEAKPEWGADESTSRDEHDAESAETDQYDAHAESADADGAYEDHGGGAEMNGESHQAGAEPHHDHDPGAYETGDDHATGADEDAEPWRGDHEQSMETAETRPDADPHDASPDEQTDVTMRSDGSDHHTA